MKTLTAAFVLALLAILSVVILLSLVGVEKAVAVSLATTIIGGVPHIRESLDKHLAGQAGLERAPVLSLKGMDLPAHRLILYGTLMLMAAMQFASGLGGIVAAILEVKHEQLFVAVGVVIYLVVFPAAFFVGRWVGRRSEKNGLLIIFLIAVVTRISASFFDFLVMEESDVRLMLAPLGSEESVLWQGFVMQAVLGIILFTVLGAVGYWRGRRQRLGSYLGYLLRNVPHPTQLAIVELAFEEASRGSLANR